MKVIDIWVEIRKEEGEAEEHTVMWTEGKEMRSEAEAGRWKEKYRGRFKKERKHVSSGWKSAEGGMVEGEKKKKNQDDKEVREWGNAADSLIIVFSQTIQPRCHLFLMTTLCALVCVKIV